MYSQATVYRIHSNDNDVVYRTTKQLDDAVYELAVWPAITLIRMVIRTIAASYRTNRLATTNHVASGLVCLWPDDNVANRFPSSDTVLAA